MSAPVTAGRAPRLLLTADAVGGVWTYGLDLARGLADAGVEVVLAVLGPSPGADQVAAAERIPGLRLMDTRLPLDWTARGPGELMDAGWALRAPPWSAAVTTSTGAIPGSTRRCDPSEPTYSGPERATDNDSPISGFEATNSGICES